MMGSSSWNPNCKKMHSKSNWTLMTATFQINSYPKSNVQFPGVPQCSPFLHNASTQCSSKKLEDTNYFPVLCPTLCDPMGYSTPGFPILHYLPEFAQIHVHWVSDAIQPSHSLPPLLLLPSIFPSIRVFSSELVVHIR